MSLIELYITFIEKNGTLLKVFGQVDQNSAEFLEKLLYQYTDTFDRLKVGEPKAARDIYPGLRCCARYKDNKYYRAEVKSVVQLSPGYVSVFFIDYGNTDRVKLSDIRLLDDIREPTLSNLHSLATEYYLAGVRPVTSEWDEHTINFVEEAIRYRSVKCAIIGEVIGKKLVKIFWGESDVSSYLIGMGAAVPVTQEVQEILIETSSGVVPTRYSVPPPAPVATPTLPVAASVPSMSSYPSMAMRNPSVGMQVPFTPMVTRPTLSSSQSVLSLPTGIRPVQPPPVMSVPPPTAIPPQPFSMPVLTQGKPQGQFASEMLPENTEHAVYVSHVEDGPLSFAVQLKAVAEHALTDLMAALNEHDPVPISRPLLPGSICLGRFSEDQSLCRAVVMLVMNDKCRLYYPDYGNSEVLPCSQIYDMPLQFLEIKVMALRFTLAGFKNVKVTQEMKDIFKDIVTDKELVMKVSPMEENRTKQYCELYLNRRNVREIMKERIAKLSDLEYVKLHVPPRGSIEKVIVSYVESPTRIVVQLESNKDTLNTVMSCVAAHCRDNTKNLLKANYLKQNMPVCALYPIDSTWYRAQIKDFNETEATVLFVDYGNEDVVPVSSLRRISPDLVTKVRVQALECCLAGFETSQSDQEIADKLYNIINEKTLTMQVLEVMKNQVLIVHLLDENSVNVSTVLKQAPAVSPPLNIAAMETLYSQPPVESNDDGWNEEPEIRHPAKAARDFQPGSGRNDNQGGKRFTNDDSERRNWRSNSNNSDSFSPREKGDRFSRDERKSGRWNKDDDNKNWRSKDDSDTKDNWRNEDSRPPRKWDRSGDGDGSDDRSNKRWENKDRNNDSGGGKWDRSGDGDDKFKKRDFRDRNRDGDGGGFNKWNKDNERGGESGGFNKWNKDDRDGDSGGFNKRNRDNRDGDSGGFNRWNKDNDRGGDSGGFKKWNKDNERDGDSGGFKKWNKDNDRDGDSGGFDKWNKNDRNGDGGGFNKWNKDNDKGSFGDGPKRFDDKKFSKSSDWNSRPRSRGEDFGSRGGGGGGSKFESRKTYSRQSSGSGGGGTPVPPKKVVVPYPDITIGVKENVEIVYSLSPAEFFVQTSKYKDELTNLMSTIATNYTTDGAVLTSPEKGMYCVAMYSEDEVWYRALIETVNVTTANVLFIDYGNSEEIPLEKLKVMTNDLSTLSAQAIKCGLLAVKPRSNDKWSDEEQTEFAVATEGKTLQAELINKTFANDTFQIILRDITDGEDSAAVINTIFNATEEELSSASIPLDSANTFKPYPLTIGESLDVQVTWFISPDSFFIQPLISNPAFREMMEHIQEHVRSFKHLSPFEVQVGKNIIARFKEDKVLYRAEIKETGFVGPQVYFVDYGNSETVEKNQLYEVKPEYSLMPCQAIACSLAGVKPSGEEWPKLGSSNIEHFFEADLYKCTVLAEGESGNFIVSLDNQDGSNVYKQLIDNGLAVADGTSYSTPLEEAYTTIQLRLLINQTLQAHVTFVENTSKFFVQFLPLEAANLQQELDALTSQLDSLKKIEPDNITDNMLCISTLDGTLWQRATVVSKSGTSGPLIRCIDNGASGEVSNDKILELPSEYSSIPAQAVECYLGISELAEGDEDEFRSEVFDKDVIINVNEVDSERLQVTVYSNDGNLLKLLQEKTDKPKQVDVVCPLPILKKEDRLIISHAESGAIFVQRVAKVELLKELLGELYEWCEGISSCDIEWQVGALCCAKSLADDQWYRAKLLTVDPEFSVKYLDYGNSEVVSADRLRKLETSFYKPEAFALEVKMAVSWQVSEENLLELVPDKEFYAQIIKWHDDWYVELVDDNNENLSDKLIELGFATALENSPFIKKVSSISKLSAGLKFNVCRSHICSPSQFCVILNEDFEDLEHLQDRLQNSITSMKDIAGTLPKSMIAAKFSDGIWYRAIYFQEENSIFSVDYGNTEPSNGEFKELSEDFLTPDGYAITCTLNIEPIENSWSNEAIEYFDSLIPDDVIIAHILKMDKIVTVDIKVNDESISKALVDKGFAVKSILTSSIYISHVNSLSDFYVQEENPLLEQIREHLLLFDNFNSIEDIGNFTGDIFAAQYHIDGLWYRAKLLSSDESGHNVLFVDYGNSDVATEFKELPNELLELPFMAKNCSLKLPDSDETWIDGALEKFIELVADGSALFDIKFLSDDEPSLVELSLNGQLVCELINVVDSAPCEEHPTDNSRDDFRRIVVSHINNPCDFWIQSENAPLAELADFFVDVENWNVLNIDGVIPNQLVAALFDEDAQWYRAKVISVTENDCAKVLFIDYGNSSSAKELRQLPEELSQLPPAAEHCCMQFPNIISEWPTEIINHFKELTGHGTEILTMETISTEEPLHVKLFNGDNDIALKLSEIGLEKVSAENVHLEPIREILDSDNKLDVTQTVSICHINSPADFYIHTDKNKVDEMVNALCEGENFEPLSVKSLGALVAARFVDDGQWYRATITRSADDSCEVFFVDYGNSATVTELKSLPQNLLDIPHLAQLCSFQTAGEIEDWTESATDKFFELSADGMTEFGLQVISDGFPTVIELMLDGKPVSLMLLESGNSNNEGEIKQQSDGESSEHTLNTVHVSEELDEANLIKTDSILDDQSVLTLSGSEESNKGDEKQLENENSNGGNETQLQNEPGLNIQAAEELEETSDIEISNENAVTSLQGAILTEEDDVTDGEKVTKSVVIEKGNEEEFTIDKNFEKCEREEIKDQNNITDLVETIKEVDVNKFELNLKEDDIQDTDLVETIKEVGVVNNSELDVKEDDIQDKLADYSSCERNEAVSDKTIDGINLKENNELLINKTVINDNKNTGEFESDQSNDIRSVVDKNNFDCNDSNTSEFESNQCSESHIVVDNKSNSDCNDRDTELPMEKERTVGEVDNCANIGLDVISYAKSEPNTHVLDSGLPSNDLAVDVSSEEMGKEDLSSRLENNLITNNPSSSEEETKKTDVSCSDSTFAKIPMSEKIVPGSISHGNLLDIDESANTDK